MTNKSEGLLPSFAIKFLLDYEKSENLFGMPNFTGKYADNDDMENEESYFDMLPGAEEAKLQAMRDAYTRALERAAQ